VDVALRCEQDPISAGVVPVMGVLPGVGTACSENHVRASCTFPRPCSIAANEDHDRYRVHAAPVAGRVRRPARHKMVVALELASRGSGGQPVVELDDQVNRGRVTVARGDPAAGEARAERREIPIAATAADAPT
jgi:hypothetical protein